MSAARDYCPTCDQLMPAPNPLPSVGAVTRALARLRADREAGWWSAGGTVIQWLNVLTRACGLDGDAPRMDREHHAAVHNAWDHLQFAVASTGSWGRRYQMEAVYTIARVFGRWLEREPDAHAVDRVAARVAEFRAAVRAAAAKGGA